MKNKLFKKMMSAALALVMVFGMAACKPPETPKTDLELVKEALESVTLPAEASANLTLPTLDADKYPGVGLTFKSSNTAAITDAGAVTRSSAADVNVTFTVTAKKGEAEDFKNFPIKVLKRALTDAEKVAEAKAALVLTGIEGLSDNIVLPETAEGGVSITWATSDAAVITAEGVINPNNYGGSNKTATLTATITSGTASDTKAFAVTVLAKGLSSLPVTVQYTAVIELADGTVPTLLMTGSAVLDSNNEVTRTITLLVDKDEHVIRINNDESLEESTAGEFSFEVDLTELDLKVNDWIDLRLEVVELGVTKKTDFTATSAWVSAQPVIIEDEFTSYKFEEYDELLKIHKVFRPVVSELASADIAFVEEEGEVFLNIKGSIHFAVSTTAQRTITLTAAHSKLTAPITTDNISADADTSKFEFMLPLADVNTGAHREWLDLKITFEEEGYGSITIDILTGSQINYETKKFSYDGLDFEFENTGGAANPLKIVVRSSEINDSNYLDSTTKINLTKETGTVYLNVSDKAWLGKGGSAADKVRIIKLKIGNDEYDSELSGDATKDGSYTFKISEADLKKYTSLGKLRLDILVSEDGGATFKEWEVKQDAWNGAGTIVTKPGSGTADFISGGEETSGNCTFKLAVDEWNNIKLVVTTTDSATLSNLVTTADINLVNEGGRVYLVINGTATLGGVPAERVIKLIIFKDDNNKAVGIYFDNTSTDPDSTKFAFKADITDFADSGDWHKFAVQVCEDGEYAVSGFANNTFTGPVTSGMITQITENGKNYELKYEYDIVHLQVHNA